MSFSASDRLITGLPRSGTSLINFLLNQCENTVSLAEPPMPILINAAGLSHHQIRDGIADFYRATRESILRDGTALSWNIGGKFTDNDYSHDRLAPAIRPIRSQSGTVKIEKPLERDFILCTKHPAPFTAVLDVLCGQGTCFALIRNPLAVLASWNSVDVLAGRLGRLPAAEGLDVELSRKLEQIPAVAARQLYLLDWFFDKYRRVLSADQILRYEDIVADPSRLGVITPSAKHLSVKLQNRNSGYSRGLLAALAGPLLASDGAYWHFYSRESVYAILQESAT
jgi:hypothetical protein